MSNVYYKLYMWHGKITVVCMQAFDEPDYNQAQFYLKPDGTPFVFGEEAEAAIYLNEHFRACSIDPEYLSPNNREFMKPCIDC